MASVEDALQTQIRNIEAKYGRSMAEWAAVIQASGKTRHSEILAWLKGAHGMSHGDANRVALVARQADAASIARNAEAAGEDPVRALYAGPKAALLPIHDSLMALVRKIAPDTEEAPKSAYISLRRKKQFAMLQPSTASRLDLGLILPGATPHGRLEASGSFNAMFSHRVRLTSPDDVDDELAGWLRAAADRAG